MCLSPVQKQQRPSATEEKNIPHLPNLYLYSGTRYQKDGFARQRQIHDCLVHRFSQTIPMPVSAF